MAHYVSPQESRPLSVTQESFCILRLFRACDLLPDRLSFCNGDACNDWVLYFTGDQKNQQHALYAELLLNLNTFSPFPGNKSQQEVCFLLALFFAGGDKNGQLYNTCHWLYG